MLPLSLLTTAQGSPMLVELKSGETYNGHLMQCDNYMNLTLREVIQTSREGDRFFRLPEVYIRGNNIKYLRVPEDTLDKVRERERADYQARNRGGFNQNNRGRGRGNNQRGGGDRGRGRGGRQQ